MVPDGDGICDPSLEPYPPKMVPGAQKKPLRLPADVAKSLQWGVAIGGGASNIAGNICGAAENF